MTEDDKFTKYVYESLSSVDSIMDLESKNEQIEPKKSNRRLINGLLISGMIFALIMALSILGVLK